MDILEIIESRLNLSSDTLRFKVFDMLHYHDNVIVEDGYEVVQCVLGEMSGSYIPLFEANIEDKSRMLQILFPLDKKSELDQALLSFKTRVVGACFNSENETYVLNMDVPVFSRITQQALREFSVEDGRFRFSSEPYGVYVIRIYYKEVQRFVFGNSFQVQLDGVDINPIAFSIISSRQANSLQLVSEKSIINFPNANAVSYHVQSLIDLSIAPISKIVTQAISGGEKGCYEGTLSLVIGDNSVTQSIKVICTEAQIVANKGDLASLSFTLARKG